MNADSYPPPKRRGLIVHGVILFALAGLALAGLMNLSRLEAGPQFLIALLVALFAFAPIPLFAYRGYSLWRADYRMDRDSLEIQWGLRMETIPLSAIEWMRPADDLTTPLALPALPLPGALVGARRHPDLGLVEFLASDAHKLLLVATAKRIFVISPEDPAALTQTFARATELGSLAPVAAQSVYPAFVFARAWESKLVRYLWLMALFLNVGLWVGVSLIIPSQPQITLASPFLGAPPETAPSTQLIIFPVASLLLGIAGWVAGLYFYRRERERPLAFIVWGSSAFLALLFLVAILFILSTPT
ncbi:MAG: hypothetical protein IT310_12150 [Anaerolineales bacterium]|nr:hypothetical protein [Anaerolineales bacterium]